MANFTYMMNNYARSFGVSAMMTSPWEPPAPPTTFLAMFETIDGCIKFQEVKNVEPSVTFGVHRLIALAGRESDPLDQLQTKAMKRRYALYERSGPGGRILHYREMGE